MMMMMMMMMMTITVVLLQHAATAPQLTQRSNSLNVLNYNFSKEQYMLPEDDRVIETCRRVLNVLMYILDFLNNIYIYICMCWCV